VVDLARSDPFLDFREGGELDQLPTAAAKVEPRHVARRRAPAGIELHHHVVELVVASERGDAPTAQKRLQRRGHIAHGDTQVLSAVPFERDPQLRLVDPQVGIDVREPLDATRPVRKLVHDLAQLP